LLVTPREKRLFMAIEKTIGRSIPVRALPTSEDVQSSRLEAFKQELQKQLEKPTTRGLQDQIATLAQDLEISDAELAAGLLAMVHSKRPVLVAAEQVDIELKGGVKAGFDRESRAPRERKERKERSSGKHAPSDIPMETYRVAVGRNHGVKPGDIVGALVNEAELEKAWIGRIELRDDHSFIDLPTGMPPRTHQHLARVRVRHQPLKLQLVNGVSAKPRGSFSKGAGKPKHRTER
jgi:ATP-dependent RNA helicase DeaD